MKAEALAARPDGPGDWLREIGLVSGREIKKNLRGVKGIILLAMSLIGGTAMALLLVRYFQRKLEGVNPAAIHDAQEKMFTEAFHDEAMGKYLAGAPLSLVIMLNFCVWLAPALIWLAGFDAISGEVQHRTIRYWTVRTRRGSFYIGKFLGLWATVAVITFAMHLLMWIVTISQGLYPAGDVLSWGVRFWLVSIPIIGAWCGIAAFAGSFFRTPMTSLLVVGFTFFAIFVLGSIVPAILMSLSKNMDDTTARTLAALYPNSWDRYLLSPRIERVGLGLLACLAFAGLPTAAGAYLLSKRDV